MIRAAVFYLLTGLLIFFPTIFLGYSFVPFDILRMQTPWVPYDKRVPLIPQNRARYDILELHYNHFYHTAQAVKRGELPLWCPYHLCGHPLYSDGYSAPLYPPRLILQALFEPHLAFHLFLLLHLVCAGFFMYLYLNRLGCSFLPALFGGQVWMIGALTVRMPLPDIAPLNAGLPLVLLCMEQIGGANWIPWCLIAGTFAGVILSSTHLNFAMLFFMFLSVYGLFKVLTSGPGWPRVLSRLTGILCLALLIGSPHLVAGGKLFAQSARGAMTFPIEFRFTQLLTLLTLFSPRIFGGPIDRVDLYAKFCPPFFNQVEFQIYCGILPVLLCLLPLWGHRHTRFFIAVAVISLILALFNPLLMWVSQLFFGGGSFTPYRLTYIWSFCIPVLSALSMQGLIDSPQETQYGLRRIWIFGGIGLICLLVIALCSQVLKGHLSIARWLSLDNAHIYQPIIFGGVSILILRLRLSGSTKAISITGVTLIELLIFFVAFNGVYERLPTPAPEIARLKQEQAPLRVAGWTVNPFLRWGSVNSLSYYGIERIEGHNPLNPKRDLKLFQAAGIDIRGGVPYRTIDLSSPLLRLFNMGYALVPSEVAKLSNEFQQLEVGNGMLFEHRAPLPRAFIVHRYIGLPEEDVLSVLIQGNIELEDEVILEKGVGFRIPPRQGVEKVNWTIRSLNEIQLEVLASAPGILVVLNTYHPGWRCMVDDSPAEVLRANHNFQAVIIPAGEHTVRFYFRPLGFLWLIFISYQIIFLSLMTCIIYTKVRHLKGLPDAR